MHAEPTEALPSMEVDSGAAPPTGLPRTRAAKRPRSAVPASARSGASGGDYSARALAAAQAPVLVPAAPGLASGSS
eukprot:5795160-Alexandrium_andersonii.AAC.1